jgi:polyisoprenyl-phosphate glycosyltransferase
VPSREPELVSVVTPALNEEDTIETFVDRVRTALGDVPFELIVVDDGSTDRTAEILERLASEDDRVRLLRLSRRFGHQTALTAGLDHARGDATVMLDSDLQDPPELIPEMLDHWRRGTDVVYGVRRERPGETRAKLTTARWFYGLINRLSPLDLPREAGDFRLLDRRALDALLAMRERNRYLRGMTVWVGFTQTAVPYARETRQAGRTKFSPLRMLRFSLDAVASFSYFPLQIATLMGFAFAVIAFLGIPVAIGFRIAGQFVPGIATVVIAVLLLGGIQLMAIGLIGEYVGRIYEEVKRRPLYVVGSRTNLEPPPPAPQPPVAAADAVLTAPDTRAADRGPP